MLFTGGEKELPASVQFLLAAFRQLCGLLWFLHTRDQVSSKERHLHPSALKVSIFHLKLHTISWCFNHIHHLYQMSKFSQI